jgi:hypothetical protein
MNRGQGYRPEGDLIHLVNMIHQLLHRYESKNIKNLKM